MQRRAAPDTWFKGILRSPLHFCRRRALLLVLCLLVAASLLQFAPYWAWKPSNDIVSLDIETYLLELEALVQAAGPDAPAVRARLLREAAGQEPRPNDEASRAFLELRSSISALAHTLPCSAVAPPSALASFNASACSGGCFFASNLYNSFHILPNFILQLLAALGSLQDSASSFVSVYESGSTDATPPLLGVLRRTLALLGVPNRITTNGQLNRSRFSSLRLGGGPVAGNDRIAFLAAVRNAVLEPLTSPACRTAHAGSGGAATATSGGEGGSGGISGGGACARHSIRRIVFLNDVFFCAADVLRLLQYQSADVVCGLDFIPAKLWLLTMDERRAAMAGHLAGAWGVRPATAARLSQQWLPYRIWKKLYGKTPAFWAWSHLIFYDTWVARDASGARMTNLLPYMQDEWSAGRLAQGLPVPVYCCWNGIVVLDAAPFMTAGAGASRGAGGGGGGSGTSGPVVFRTHRPGECAASECSLMCDDLHAAGRRRAVLDPNVRVTYDWASVRLLYGNSEHSAPLGVRGLSYRPPAVVRGDVAEAERGWAAGGVGAARAAAGERAVECCGIQPGLQTADFEHGCTRVDLAARWAAGRRGR